MEFKSHPENRFRHFVSLPFIYMMTIPIIIMDIFIEVYHHICFPLYGIPLVKRGNYINLDRGKLKYLTVTERINCAYCGYANGFAAYFLKIANDTEKYWCGIKHNKKEGFIPQPHQKDFMAYGDEEAYCKLTKKGKNK